MNWTLRDVDLDEASLEELKVYAGECAVLENALRKYTLSVQFEIIKRVNANFPAYTPVRRPSSKPSRPTAAQILAAEAEEDMFSMDDFK
jgi:hypothetical protein